MKKLLFTGASGFLGNNLKPLLSSDYAITTLGLTDQDDIKTNLANSVPYFQQHFDVVLHAAGKAHSNPKNKSEERSFFDVNLQGTKNLCAALEKSGVPNSFIFISTVAVYGLEFGENITEEYPLKGTGPYALSKIEAEHFLTEWCERYRVILTILRPSLIAGPNPPGNLGEMIRGIRNGRYLSIAGGKARKSMLMVQDIANLIPRIMEKGGIFNVCDNEHPSFRELEIIISKQLGKKTPITIPFWFANALANVGNLMGDNAPINSERLKKITQSLTFSNEKAKRELDWEPLSVIANFNI